jgi:hypothetical protein
MLRSPELLRRRLEDLRVLKKQRGRLEPAELEATAECEFRLGIHPDTSFHEAVARLKHSIRLDGANPKYAYHLGRLYLAHGQLQEAQTWVTQACRLCPTSHRIWSHVCWLQWELNASFYGQDRYRCLF